jgi:hypothetical protein
MLEAEADAYDKEIAELVKIRDVLRDEQCPWTL